MRHTFLIFLSVCFLTACSPETKPTTSNQKFLVTTPVLVDTTYTKEYVAEIQATQNVEIRTRVSGFLDKIYVDEGEAVKQGQELFCISDKEYQQDLQKASAVLSSALAEEKQAELELNNTKLLVNNNVLSQTELELAQAKLDGLNANVAAARASESGARLNLSYTIIRAPFDGIINRIPNKTGSLIDEGTLLTSISDIRQVFAYFNLSETEYLDLMRDTTMRGQKQVALITADNKPYPYKGVIETVEGEIDKNTGNIAFRARFDNPEQLLRHGSAGKIMLSRKIQHALLIPQKSTFEIQENTYVFVMDANNVVQMRAVKPQLRLPHLYIIDSGVSPNDKIVYEGVQYLKDGDKITPEFTPMEKLMQQQPK